jgi:homoserine kinase type II
MDAGVAEIASAWDVEVESARSPELGWNNLVWFVNEAYVLRVYRNLDAARVEAEHRLLTALATSGPPFAVPVPIPTSDGATVVATADGPAALYPFLRGRTARHGDVAELELIGAALGDLIVALRALPFELAPVDWRGPLGRVHPAVPDVVDLIAELRREAPDAPGLSVFDATWEATDRTYCAMDLPVQICHLDFGASNVLIDGGRVVAILDFEIAGLDLRINDVVAGLVQSTDGPAEEEAFLRGLRSRLELTDAEWAAVPVLRHLRLIATVAWRAGRWREGKSTLEDVLERLAALTA